VGWLGSWSRKSYTAPSSLSSVSFRVKEAAVFFKAQVYTSLHFSTTRGGALRWWWNPFRVPDGKPQPKAAQSQREPSRSFTTTSSGGINIEHQYNISFYMSIDMLSCSLLLLHKHTIIIININTGHIPNLD
jgi:hypothetical protein